MCLAIESRAAGALPGEVCLSRGFCWWPAIGRVVLAWLSEMDHEDSIALSRHDENCFVSLGNERKRTFSGKEKDSGSPTALDLFRVLLEANSPGPPCVKRQRAEQHCGICDESAPPAISRQNASRYCGKCTHCESNSECCLRLTY